MLRSNVNLMYLALFGAVINGCPSLALAQSAPAATEAAPVNAKLICGPHSSDPKRLKAFQVLVPFTISQGRLEGSRKLKSNGGGEENFSGTISSDLVLVSGAGKFASGDAWIYQFTGKRSRSAETILTGRLENTLGSVGTRECKLHFLRSRPAI